MSSTLAICLTHLLLLEDFYESPHNVVFSILLLHPLCYLQILSFSNIRDLFSLTVTDQVQVNILQGLVTFIMNYFFAFYVYEDKQNII